MPTTVHIPSSLLDRVDARAKALGVSRNSLVIQALEEKLSPRREWPPELIELLGKKLSAPASAAVDEMLEAIHRGRASRKRPPAL